MKHLSFEERILIEEKLNKNVSIHKIAISINRSDSTIRNEIIKHRYQIDSLRKRSYAPCLNEDSCDVMNACEDKECTRYCLRCYRICPSTQCFKYEPKLCVRIIKSPFVCNGCSQLFSCNNEKYKYVARKAQIEYDNTLKTSREGINLTPGEMEQLDDLITPLLLNGQSISAIYMEHKEEIPCSVRTLYNYVEGSYFTAKSLDLTRKVRFKKRRSHGKSSRNHEPFAVKRTYADFKEYIKNNPDKNIVEMDTVIGKIGGKCLLTLMFRNCSLMIAILLEKHNQSAVSDALNNICENIGIATFKRLFGVILTDRGTEFTNPYAIESDNWGEIKTRLFYCDPQCSWQKGMIERNHEFIRMILPSGTNFNKLAQEDITLMMNHINNYPRASLNDHSPMQLAHLLLDEKLLKALNYVDIQQDDIILRPKLMKNNHKYN